MHNNEIEKLIELYGNDILRIANIYLKNCTIAEDIFQEVFIKAFKNINSFRGDSSEKTWLIRITINACKDYLKNSYTNKVIPIEDTSDLYNNSYLDNNLLESEKSSVIINEILSLPSKYKDVIILYYYQSFSTSEIAKILHLPETSVRTRMRRAREILKNKLQITLED